MIDAEAVDPTRSVQAKKGGVNRFEYLVIFNPDCSKFVDVEKSSPIDVLIGRAPPG